MISLPDIKKLILQYKETRESRIYHEIILHLDYLVYYYINKLRKRFVYLNHLGIEELYHTSLIALHNFILTFKEDTKHSYIPCRLRSYMKLEFTKTYRYLERENNFKDIYKYTPTGNVTELNTLLMDYDHLLSKLSSEDREVLSNYCTKSKQVSKMARERGVAVCTMTKRIKTIIKKLGNNTYVKH